MKHTSLPTESTQEKCPCEPVSAIPFLDTLCSIENGRIETDLYRKDTDRNQYLLPSSCHPVNCTTKSIPVSLALRIVRICSKPEWRDQRLEELSNLLQSRGYSTGVINRAIYKAKSCSRKRALKKVTKNNIKNRPVFAVKYDPRLPSIQSIQSKHWRSMINQDPYLSEVFPKPPLTAFKKQRNIRDILIK